MSPQTEPTTVTPPPAEAPPSQPSLADSLDIGGPHRAASAEPVHLRGRVDRYGVAIGTGRRKTAVARVRIKDGSGQIKINDRELEDYFPFIRDRKTVLAPLVATEMEGKVDVWVRVNGGGPTGQCGAIALGIARALEARDAGLHRVLSEGGYLTRDGRMVERKKYGRRKARRSFQFSKR